MARGGARPLADGPRSIVAGLMSDPSGEPAPAKARGRVGRALWRVGWAPLLLALPAVAIAPSGEGGGLLRMALLALAAVLLGAALLRLGQTGGVLLVTALSILLLVPEIALRAAGFRFETGMDFGLPGQSFVRFRPDPELLYTMRPSRRGVHRLGFPGEPFDAPKPPGVCRVVFLGDSVPAQQFDRRLERILTRLRPSAVVDGVSLAMPGYTSHQGRIALERHGELLEPDIVVVLYGWNDHWLAAGAADAEKVVTRRDGPLLRAAGAAYRSSRLVQAGAWLAQRLRRSARGAGATERVLRVPIDAYERNLEAIGERASRGGALLLLVSPPTSFYDRGVPSYYLEQEYAVSADSAVQLHRSYNERLRRLARRRGWPLLDLERQLEGASEVQWIFLEDGIHLTEEGADELVERIAKALLEIPAAERCLSGGADPADAPRGPEAAP